MWRRIFRSRRDDQDLHDELQGHLETEIAQLTERGLTREQAEARARQMFGNRTLVYEVTREKWGFGWIERLWQDLRYAARTLSQNPAFTVAATLSLALGIGASTAVFSIADTVFLRPLPYPHPEKLVWVALRTRANTEFLLSPDYVAWRRENRVFEQLAATPLGDGPVILSGAVTTEISVKRVSANFLQALEITPALGRAFRPEEELPNGPKSVILMDHFWRSQFGAHRNILGQQITLDGQPYTIVGVLPKTFVFPMEVKLDLLLPLTVAPDTGHRGVMMMWAVIGRLKPGATLAQARADVSRLFAASRAGDPLIFRYYSGSVVEPLQQHEAGNARLLLLILAGAVSCLLLIACANVANLLLARWSARSRELAMRAAIGAARSRLIRQLFTETVLLTLLGCTLGLGIVTLTIRGFHLLAGRAVPRLNEVAMDSRVMFIASLVSAVTALLFGVLPALRAGRVDIHTVLQQSNRLSTAARHSALRRSLVVVELALSLTLLSAAALLFQTLWHLENDHLGFEPEHAFSLLVNLKGTKFEKSNHAPLASDLLAFVRTLPGTEAAALGICSPPMGLQMVIPLSRSDRPLPQPFHPENLIASCGAGVDYFKVLGTPLLTGRSFTEADMQHPGTAAVINEAAARAYFANESPLGKQIGGDREGHWKTIIGIVADAKNQGLNKPAMPEMFINDLELATMRYISLKVRTRSDENTVIAAIRRRLRAIDPGLFGDFATLNEGMRLATAGPRFNTVLLASFASIAFLMAIIGVYGVLAFAVTQRTREIGIRIALGAKPRRVLLLILGEGAGLMSAGVIAGLCGSFALTRYLTSLLYNVRANDARTYAAVVVVLSAAAIVASLLPARRAASVDPAITLRQE